MSWIGWCCLRIFFIKLWGFLIDVSWCGVLFVGCDWLEIKVKGCVVKKVDGVYVLFYVKEVFILVLFFYFILWVMCESFY